MRPGLVPLGLPLRTLESMKLVSVFREGQIPLTGGNLEPLENMSCRDSRQLIVGDFGEARATSERYSRALGRCRTWIWGRAKHEHTPSRRVASARSCDRVPR